MRLLMHDWGGVGLLLAQRLPRRVERLVLINTVPLLPGYRWHRTARIWRTRGLGELAMGATGRRTLRLSTRESNVTPGRSPSPGSTRCSRTSTRAPSARSCACIVARPRARSQLQGSGSASSTCLRSMVCGHEDATSRRASAAHTRTRSRTRRCWSWQTQATGRGSTAPTCSIASPSSSPQRERAQRFPRHRAVEAPGRRRPALADQQRAQRTIRERRAGARMAAHRCSQRRLPDHLAREPRPRRGQLPQRPVLAVRAHALGQLVVRRAPSARLLVLAPALGACSARAARTRCRWRGDRAVRAAARRPLPGAGDARSRRCGSRSARPSGCSPTASPSTSGSRSASRALLARSELVAHRGATPHAGWRRLACALRARSPAPWRERSSRSPMLACALAGPARLRAGVLTWRRSRRSRCSCSRSPKAARSRLSPPPSTPRCSACW